MRIPVDFDDLVHWMRTELTPLQRAHLTGLLVEAQHTVALAAIRREAIYEATRWQTAAEVAEALGMGLPAVRKAVARHAALLRTEGSIG